MRVDLGQLGRFAFLTLPNFSMIAFSNAIEVCRMANYVSGRDAYHWSVVSLDGAPAVASNGLGVTPTRALGEADPFDVLFVCGGVNVRHSVDRRLADALRRHARRGTVMGGLCTGTFALAEAGLLDGYSAAIHWENLSSIREEFGDVAFTDDLFVFDRDRVTCTGGVAPLDMMLKFVAARLGRSLAARVSEQFVVERPRDAGERQRVPAAVRAGARHPALTKAAALMATTIERPLTVEVLARTVGVSARQLERLFRQHLGTSPADHYLSLRLDRARELLTQSPLSVTDIGIACGFQSASHFSVAYRRQFGHAPRTERALA